MPLPTLLDLALRAQTRERLSRFPPDAPRVWGVMTAAEAVCHLAVSYRMVASRVSAQERTGLLQRTAFKRLALHVDVRWARGYPTLPEVKAGAPGVIPQDFTSDRDRLLADYDAFVQSATLAGTRHPIFGPLTEWEWMRWGYLHADHHLRQFSL
jgi:hypothetical protein